jgi:hypothetical protein
MRTMSQPQGVQECAPQACKHQKKVFLPTQPRTAIRGLDQPRLPADLQRQRVNPPHQIGT